MSEITALHDKTVVKIKGEEAQDPLVSRQPIGKATFQISNRLEGRSVSVCKEDTESSHHATKTSLGVAGAIPERCLNDRCNCHKKAKLARVG